MWFKKKYGSWVLSTSLALTAVACGGEEEAAETPACEADTNAAPTPPIVSITPSEPTTDDALVARLVEPSVDADEDAVTPRIKWFKNGEAQDAFAGQLEIPASETAKGELWKVEILGFDGVDAGYPGGAQVEIANTAPVATATLEPDAPTTTDDLNVTLVGEDVDGDQVAGTYSWSKNGAPYVDAETGQPVTGSILSSEHTERDDTWQVIVTPNDGDNDGNAIVLSVSIANALPVLDETNVGLDPFNATGDTDLSVTISSLGVSDADGDTVQFTYVWKVGTLTLGDETSSSLSSTYFDAGDTVSVSITPYDGIDYGLAVTKSVVIGN